jgi:hypothetical protein
VYVWVLRVFAVMGGLFGLAFFASALLLQQFEAELRNAELNRNDLTWRAYNERLQRYSTMLAWHSDWLDAEVRWYQLGSQLTDISLPEKFVRLRRAYALQSKLIKQRSRVATQWLTLARLSYELDPQSDSWKVALTNAIKLRLRGGRVMTDLLRFRRQVEMQIDAQLLAQLEPVLAQGFVDRPVEMAYTAARLNRLDWVCNASNLAGASDYHQKACFYANN